jgi:hypothetical protein
VLAGAVGAVGLVARAQLTHEHLLTAIKHARWRPH